MLRNGRADAFALTSRAATAAAAALDEATKGRETDPETLWKHRFIKSLAGRPFNAGGGDGGHCRGGRRRERLNMIYQYHFSILL